MTTEMDFGERVRFLRQARKMTQRELAEEVGIDHTQVSHIEAGRRDNPTLVTVRKIADALDADITILIGDTP